MSGYRFCRTDDIPLLVDAFNDCGAPTAERWTVEEFKRGVRELGLWASSSMLAFDGERPIGVLLGAKRDDANLVYRIIVREEYRRRGHGRHLLESLRDKVAILGPPRLLAEIDAEAAAARRFFENAGFIAESRYVDFVAAGSFAGISEGQAAVMPVAAAEILDAEEIAVPRAWERSVDVIRKRAADTDGAAIATDAVEAYVLHRGHEIVALGGRRPELLRLVLAVVERRAGAPLRIPRLSEAELPFAAAEALGFRAETEYIGYAAEFDR